MEIKGTNLTENLIIAAANSKIGPPKKQSWLKNLETKMINILDDFLANVSASYREKRATLSNRIMALSETKQGARKVFIVGEKVYQAVLNPVVDAPPSDPVRYPFDPQKAANKPDLVKKAEKEEDRHA